MTPDFSFIIPTLNEAHTLDKNLSQFAVLDGRETYEVIVADGGSVDETREVAAGFDCRVVVNRGKQTIGSNRNLGAATAQGKVLVFCDADTRFANLPEFCRAVRSHFSAPNVVGAMPRISVFPEQQIPLDRTYHALYNGSIRWSFRTPFPFGSGQCQVVRASAFRRVSGYPASQVHGEDTTLFRRLSKLGKLVYLNDQTILESPRRYRHYGYFRFITISGFSLIGQGLLQRNILKEWKRVG